MTWPAIRPVGFKQQKGLLEYSTYVITEMNMAAKTVKPLADSFRT